MKKIVAVLLVMLLLAGCKGRDEAPQIAFYYPRASYGQYSEDSVIASEIRENAGASAAIEMLNLYLQGPLDPLLTNPFPEGICVLSIYVMEDTVNITVSDELAQLNGVSLVLACTALGKTATVMTKTESAIIRCETAKLNGLDSFTVTDGNILFLDTPPQETVVSNGE